MSTIKIDSKKAREFQLDDSNVIWLQAMCSDTEQIKAKMIRLGIIAVQKDMLAIVRRVEKAMQKVIAVKIS